MKRMFLALSLAMFVSISLGVGVASASHSEGEGPNKDLLVGTVKDSQRLTESDTGIVFTSDEYFHFNAQSGPAGENTRGHFAVRVHDSGGSRLTDFDATGEVMCLTVRDKQAFVIGLVERNKGDDPLEALIVILEDTGEGKEPNDLRAITVFLGPGPEPFPRLDDEECRILGNGVLDFFIPGTGSPFDQGNIIVHDAAP